MSWHQDLIESHVVGILAAQHRAFAHLQPVDIINASRYQDMREATDLFIAPGGPDLRCMIRLRNNNYLRSHPNDITFRCQNANGGITEVQKVFGPSSFGDLMFYGFANEEQDDMVAWRIVDIRALRVRFDVAQAQGHVDRFFGRVIPNKDGTALHAIDVARYPEVTLASSGIPVQYALFT